MPNAITGTSSLLDSIINIKAGDRFRSNYRKGD